MAHVIGSELEEKKPKKKKVWLWIVLAIIVIIVTVFGYFVYKDLEQEELLHEEIAAYMELDLAEDEFVVDIKTTGDYAILEKAIKTYFKDFSDLVKAIDVVLEDEAFLNILSAENYEEDGPLFVTSLQKINDIRNSMDMNLQKLSEMCSEEYMLSLIDGYSLDSYYIDLYKDILYTEDELEDIKETREELVQVKDKFFIFLNNCENILEFLKSNRGSWVIENGTIVFENTTLLDEYTRLTDQLLEADL